MRVKIKNIYVWAKIYQAYAAPRNVIHILWS